MKQNIPFDKSKYENTSPKKKLLLHSCCAPCSSSVIEMLSAYFELTVFYYNPNIYPEAEYEKRIKEQEMFCRDFPRGYKVDFVKAAYDSEEFEKISNGLESEPEGGERCTRCFLLRLEKTAKYASENGFDIFATTLSVSPLKNADKLNLIGKSKAKKYGIEYLEANFKKQNGYKRSVEISNEYNMYRQDFCGCRFSLAERIMQAKGFIFDADGTLFDTMEFYKNFAPNVIKLFGLIPKPELREQIRSMTIEQACVFFKEEYELKESIEEITEKVSDLVDSLYSEMATLKSGVAEFLKGAKMRGIKMCIATASPKESVRIGTERLGISEFIDFIITCSDANTTKRESKIYVEAAKKMGLEPKDTVVFEDAHHAILSAKKGGFRVVAVKEATEIEFEKTITENSDLYVESMLEITGSKI